LTYGSSGLHLVLDLGVWWKQRTGGLPLPLGGNVIRKDLGPDVCKRVAGLIRDGIQHSLDHRPEALEYALSFARGMDPKTADKFVGMYVNDLTLDYGMRGEKALHRLFDEAVEKGLLPHKPEIAFVE